MVGKGLKEILPWELMPAESDIRELFSFKCRQFKLVKEPGEFGENHQTGFKRATCTSCYDKRQEREMRAQEVRAVTLRFRQGLLREAAVAAGFSSDVVMLTLKQKRQLAREAREAREASEAVLFEVPEGFEVLEVESLNNVTIA